MLTMQFEKGDTFKKHIHVDVINKNVCNVPCMYFILYIPN